jgi:oxygen-dependent protoporphyrinogen oxidase
MAATAVPRVAVVGGGISGLTAAWSLTRRTNGRPLDVVLLEADRRAGGKVLTVDVDGLALEAGPDSFVVRKPWAVDLCRDLGLEDRVIIPGASGASVLVNGRLVELPSPSAFGIPGSPKAWLAWPGLTRRGAVRAVGDLVRPRSPNRGDESMGALLRRRLGHEAAVTLVEPLLAGLHAGDPMRLSVAATFPELATWEQGLGSLIRGARAALKAADEPGPGRRPLFATLWGGLSSLIASLESAVGPDRIRLDAPVARIDRQDGGERPAYGVHAAEEDVAADAVILATPAFESSRLLAPMAPGLASELEAIPYASTAVVLLVYPPGTAGRLPEEGTGFVVPQSGSGVVTACTWISRKWPSEEFDDRAVLRCFVGRAGREEALESPDDDLVEAARGEVEPVLGLSVGPQATRVVRWRRSMPQYEVGHLDRLARISHALASTPGVFLTGAAYRGIGLADCVRNARETADQVRAYLGAHPAENGPAADPRADRTTTVQSQTEAIG